MIASACEEETCRSRPQDLGHDAPARPRARKLRLAILLSQPVQYFAPLFRQLAQRPEIKLTVIYCSLGGAEAYFDPEFGRTVKWDTPLLEGYRYRVLRAWWPEKVQGLLAYFAPSVVREIKASSYDALIVLGWSNFTCWLAFLKVHLESLPLILYGDTNALYERDKRGLKKLLRNWLLHALFRQTSAFLASGTSNRRFYEFHRVPGIKCFDAPFAIDNNFFRNGAQKARARRAEIRSGLGIPANAILLLFVGKLVPHKRPQDVLEVLNALRGEFTNLGAVFVGDGKLRSALEELIAKRNITQAYLLGFRNQSALPALYSTSDVFISSSSLDAKPLVTNEAMACGLPLVVSDRTGVWGPGNLVRHGENGFVYPCGDVQALAKAVRKLAADRELRERMGNRSREIIEQFSTERCAEGIVNALHFACSRSTSSG
jgi:glycosyltransferase involved in cell wall biosynthesis